MVSILTLTFNHQLFIEECIKSALGQTYEDWEMIIIDDGSKDRTPEIVRQYQNSDPRIRSIRKEHRGLWCLGDNYNHALQMAKGQYVLILDGDDFLPPNRIERQLPAFEDQGVVLSYGTNTYVYDNGTVRYRPGAENDVLNNDPVGSAFKLFLQGFNLIGTQTVMVRKSALLEAGGFTQPEYLPLVDYPTWMKLALKGRFRFIPEALGYWRRHPACITINNDEQIFDGFLKYCEEFVVAFHEELGRLGLGPFLEKRGGIAYLSLAWIKLSKGSWGDALALSRRSWNCREVMDWTFRMKIILATLGAHLHWDIPGSLKRIKRWSRSKMQ